MSHALLLRLFLSPSFFSVHVALRYLQTYPDNVGITYYLTRRLREIDIHELHDVWGFICHLLVSRPSKSRALECLVVEGAQKSTHIAMITLWFMQASLRDLSSTSHESPSFMICQRILLKCHEIIFGDLPSISSPYSTLAIPLQAYFTKTKVGPHVNPALVGLGVVLAGAPGMPRLTAVMGEVAIEQGRVDDESTGSKSLQVQDDQVARSISTFPNSDPQLSPEDEINESEMHVPFVSDGINTTDTNRSKTDINLRRETMGGVQTTPALPIQLQNAQKLRLSLDPLDQLGSKPTSRPATPSQSSPSISTARAATRVNTLGAEELILQKYDLQSQNHLLRSHYCRSEVQFLLSLENVSNRLLVVPKPARVSALRAELTALNHNLPAEVCLPMWCRSSDRLQDSLVTSQPHHRIVRIPPGESVVLNSAERAPYLLLIEILHDDLDFDPRKRGNKEVLKRIVAKEAENKTTSHVLSFDRTSNVSHRSGGLAESAANADVAEENVVPIDPPDVVAPETPTQVEEDEMDLVEQLFGTDQSVRSRPIDLSESIVLPPPPKNKELDMAAWSRQTPVTLSPAREHVSSLASHASDLSKVSGKHRDLKNGGRFLSLDEYSERMRTAAIMLTQLNANLVREPVTPLPMPGTPSYAPDLVSTPKTGWGLGSTLLSNEQSKQKGFLHPSFATNLQDNNSSAPAMPMRMKLQHAEAAAIRDRIMKEMLALEGERMERMREHRHSDDLILFTHEGRDVFKTADDERIVRRELDKVDPSAVVFSESWAVKKSRIQHSSPYGHLANWDCISVIVKTGADLRQEQFAVLLIQEFDRIWREENVQCWVRFFRILITGGTSGIVETITDAVSIHSIKKAQYARQSAEDKLGHVTLLDHFKATYGDPSSAKFARAQRNFAKSLAGYSIVTYLLQIKDRHNGNILLDREGHLIHIDFGFMLSNSPGNIGFEAAPFKLSPEYIEVLGGVDGQPFLEFRRLFREGFEASRKHCDRIITLVELMQKDSTLPCFAAFREQTANQLRDRFQPTLTHSLIGEYVDRLIDSSLGSNWTRLYDSYQYYSQSIL